MLRLVGLVALEGLWPVKARAGEMFAENLKRYLRAEPLLNEYSPDRHY